MSLEQFRVAPDRPAQRGGARAPSVAKTLFRSPGLFRFIMNVWPPYWGTGIWISEVAPDFRRMTVRMKRHAYNSNAFGTHFGGSLYAMCDPHHALLLVALLGDAYTVWDRAARIDFVAPGRSTVRATFEWTDEEIAEIRRRTAGGERYEPEKVVEVIDARDRLVARVHKTLYVRRRAMP